MKQRIEKVKERRLKRIGKLRRNSTNFVDSLRTPTDLHLQDIKKN